VYIFHGVLLQSMDSLMLVRYFKVLQDPSLYTLQVANPRFSAGHLQGESKVTRILKSLSGWPLLCLGWHRVGGLNGALQYFLNLKGAMDPQTTHEPRAWYFSLKLIQLTLKKAINFKQKATEKLKRCYN
jgi:hypothetical protein